MSEPGLPATTGRGRRRADLRFVLPEVPTSALSIGTGGTIDEALIRCGAPPPNEGPPDLVIAPRTRVTDAIRSAAPNLLIEGPVSARRLRRAGYEGRQLLVLPSPHDPQLIVPLKPTREARRALRQRLAGAGRGRRLRASTALVVAAAGITRPMRGALASAATREPAVPFVLRDARRFGIPAGASWSILLGRGDDLQRVVVLVTPEGEREPCWAVKLARVPGLREPFERDERGLRLLADAGRDVAAHGPRWLGRAEVGGLSYSVETAARGHRMADLLRPRRRGGEALLDAVADWVVRLGVASAAPSRAWDEGRLHLREELSAAWGSRLPVDAIVEGLPPITPVLQHNDLGTWNIVAKGTDFTVVDWESATPAGLPLWDLLYLLADATAHLAGEAGPGRWTPHAAALFRGEAAGSALAFEWIRRAARAAGVPSDAVGPIATLGWLHHGRSHLARAQRLRAVAGEAHGGNGELAHFAARWIEDPALGVGWSAWR